MASPTKVKGRSPKWLRPTWSHNHGVYVVLLVACLTGAAAARQWTLTTTLAMVCAFMGFQAEYPLSLQLMRRRWKIRFLVWGGIYGAIAAGLALYLYLKTPLLLWVYGGAIATVIIDSLAVRQKQQKSHANELISFAAVCLATPLVYIATTGTFTPTILGLWLLNTLFFGSTIFTVKIRKPKTTSLTPLVLYHLVAIALIIALYGFGLLTLVTALSYSIALCKFVLVVTKTDWFRMAPIQTVAMIETMSGFVFLAIVSLTLLPTHLV
ncbi:hypothetical protein NIES208_15555 [[Limnothrix rosea] IAM M-220]|nr:hypothetical protein NIES208_15555 [[Limnothrix rosea] IAM M-220]